MSRWYGAFDAFLLTSENEGTPVVAIEALASECPVVATNAGGTATVVRDGESGYLAPDRGHDRSGRPPPRARRRRPGSPARWARPERSTCRQRFASETMADAVDALYRRLLDAP